MNRMNEDEITSEIFEWIEKNDCRSISIVYRYAEVKYKHWLNVLNDRKRYRGIKFYVKSRNQGQRAEKIKAPEGMTLYKKGGGLINPLSFEIDEER